MFNFRLQTILDVRKTLEDKVLFEFSEQQKSLLREEHALQAIRQQITFLVDTLRDLKGKAVNVSEITMTVAQIKQCLQDEEVQKERVKRAEVQLERKREALLEAMQKRKAMEVIKDKHLEEYQARMNQIEQRVNDEMTIVRHQRREEG